MSKNDRNRTNTISNIVDSKEENIEDSKEENKEKNIEDSKEENKENGSFELIINDNVSNIYILEKLGNLYRVMKKYNNTYIFTRDDIDTLHPSKEVLMYNNIVNDLILQNVGKVFDKSKVRDEIRQKNKDVREKITIEFKTIFLKTADPSSLKTLNYVKSNEFINILLAEVRSIIAKEYELHGELLLTFIHTFTGQSIIFRDKFISAYNNHRPIFKSYYTKFSGSNLKDRIVYELTKIVRETIKYVIPEKDSLSQALELKSLLLETYANINDS